MRRVAERFEETAARALANDRIVVTHEIQHQFGALATSELYTLTSTERPGATFRSRRIIASLSDIRWTSSTSARLEQGIPMMPAECERHDGCHARTPAAVGEGATLGW